MKQSVMSFALIVLAFVLGFTVNAMLSSNKPEAGYVSGVGGIFFKCQNPKALRDWYKENLGFSVNDYGAVFEYRQGADSSKKGFLQWSPFHEKTKYFEPSNKAFMINYRVRHLDQLLQHLRNKQVNIVDSVETFDYGKFVHIMDIEGNKIELWEPNDLVYEQMGQEMKYNTIK